MREALLQITRSVRTAVTWQRVGMAIGIAITVISVVVLYRLLRGIEPVQVFAAVKATHPGNIVLAALFVVAGYLTLTFYDYFALRTIGRTDVPYRIAAIAGFTSYSIGHNVGFTIFSGGTVRYRIYSTSSGLSAVEVAKICFIAGLTFWLGNAAVLGLGFIVHPEAASAVDQLPPIFNRIAGFALLTLLASYIVWVSLAPRRIGRGNWSVILPSGNLTLLQVLIGVVDLTFCAAAMYVLMPASPDIDFISLSVIFIAATLLGFASHTPGGIGVFDATMLIALSQFNKEELVGALLLFRLLYYIIPLAISLTIVAFRELVLDIKPLIERKQVAADSAAKIAVPGRRSAGRRRPRRRAPSTVT